MPKVAAPGTVSAGGVNPTGAPPNAVLKLEEHNDAAVYQIGVRHDVSFYEEAIKNMKYRLAKSAAWVRRDDTATLAGLCPPSACSVLSPTALAPVGATAQMHPAVQLQKIVASENAPVLVGYQRFSKADDDHTLSTAPRVCACLWRETSTYLASWQPSPRLEGGPPIYMEMTIHRLPEHVKTKLGLGFAALAHLWASAGLSLWRLLAP